MSSVIGNFETPIEAYEEAENAEHTNRIGFEVVDENLVEVDVHAEYMKTMS